MTRNEDAELQVIWKQLNGALYDISTDNAKDAVEAIKDCIKRLESMGVGE